MGFCLQFVRVRTRQKRGNTKNSKSLQKAKIPQKMNLQTARKNSADEKKMASGKNNARKTGNHQSTLTRPIWPIVICGNKQGILDPRPGRTLVPKRKTTSGWIWKENEWTWIPTRRGWETSTTKFPRIYSWRECATTVNNVPWKEVEEKQKQIAPNFQVRSYQSSDTERALDQHEDMDAVTAKWIKSTVTLLNIDGCRFQLRRAQDCGLEFFIKTKHDVKRKCWHMTYLRITGSWTPYSDLNGLKEHC